MSLANIGKFKLSLKALILSVFTFICFLVFSNVFCRTKIFLTSYCNIPITEKKACRMLVLLGPLSFYLHAKYASYTDSHFSIIFSIVSLCIFRYLPAPLFTILIPPIDSIIEGEDSLFYEVWVLGGELFGIEAGNDTKER